MTWPAAFDPNRVDLLVSDRIAEADARRQRITAIELLRRLQTQPGVVLADEVGMGKTFVALAVAVSAMWADKGKRPVVIMVPSSVSKKWERDFDLFRERCIKHAADRSFRWEVAENALDFFKLLDDPPSKRARIILLTHGAFHRALQDPWMKLAIIKLAMHHARLGDQRRSAIKRFLPDILRMKSANVDPALYGRLLAKDFDRWRELIAEYGVDPGDDPVPAALAKALSVSEADMAPLREALEDMPLRESTHLKERLNGVRAKLNESFQAVWRSALKSARFRSPLLVLDEAHHAKNPATRLASLFVSEEAKEDAGALEGGFERMLFLTATPFQLGHAELLNVVDRFQGIDWRSLPDLDRDRFHAQLETLRRSLDQAQSHAVTLDGVWGKLRAADLGEGEAATPPELWWERVSAAPEGEPERVQQVVRAFHRVEQSLRAAETLLRPWVVRHMRPRALVEGSPIARRSRLPGSGIRTGEVDDRSGLAVSDGALLPFLLAARAQAIVAHIAREQRDHRVYRATFADGLASSYEAFLETRSRTAERDEASIAEEPNDERIERYLGRLRQALPDESSFAEHPKIAATVERVVKLWEEGEKVLVFCHFRMTGRALTKYISAAIDRRLWQAASSRLKLEDAELRRRVESWDDGFVEGRPLDRVLRDEVGETLQAAGLPLDDHERVIGVARRFLRTPLFLLRFVDLGAKDRPAALRDALTRDSGGTSLRARLESFARFLGTRTDSERANYLDALRRIHPGSRSEPRDHDDGDDDLADVRLPNVRLANGAVRPVVRERLLQGFNTPFFPEVLIASSVMAEGVDLHLDCRHVIHHDLDWNPSTLEQRTGRIDRIGAKAEQVRKTIEVYLPYVGGTQDEKMYRVVMDRERWFQIVMGEDYKTDEFATDTLAGRVPLPESLARRLALRLDLHPGD